MASVDRQSIVEELEKNPRIYKEMVERANEPTYLYWDRFKHKFPSDFLSSEAKWFLVKQFRTLSSTDLPVRSENGDFFKWVRLPWTDEFLHKIDMSAGGQLLPHPNLLSSNRKRTLISRGIIEEAIASSQLEGAHTTRATAKKLLIEKREPKNESEKMIVNNYRTINAIENEYKGLPLSRDLLFEIHSMLTEGTIDPLAQNRFRKDEDGVVVQGPIGQQTYTTHIPPREKFVEEQIQRMIEFANAGSDEKFVHPIIKAIWLHFWIGYLHPFVDGNGRLARALFYWFLLREGYWTFMYLPISTVIKKAPVQYAMSYIYSEQDGYDMTYFYDFHMKKIMESLREFQEYIARKIDENKQVDELISKRLILNERQKQLIHYFLSEENATVSISSHSTMNSISRQTAAKDLKGLEDSSLVKSVREGKFVRFYPSSNLKELI